MGRPGERRKRATRQLYSFVKVEMLLHMEVAMKLSIEEMKQAVAKWHETNGEGMCGRELELARALFQEQRNSRAVSQINAALRTQLLSRLGVQ